MRILGVPATARASFYVYNTPREVDALIERMCAQLDLEPAEASA